MGGFVSSLLEHVGSKLEGLGTKTTAGLENNAVGREVLSLVGNKEYELNLNPEGKVVKGMIEEYHRIRSQSLTEPRTHVSAIKDWHASDATTRNGVDLKTTILRDLAKNVPPQHPVMKTFQNIAQRDPQNMDLTLENYMTKARGESRLTGIGATFGPKMQNVSPLIAAMLEHPDPRVNMNGQRVADIISNELHDTEQSYQRAPISDAKAKMNKTFEVANKAIAKSGVGKQIPLLDASPTYTPKQQAERTAHEVLRTVQIPFVAIPHVGQYFHIGMSAPLEAVGKTLLLMDRQAMHDTLEASAILENTRWDVIHSDLLARTGKIAKWTNSPTAASIIHQGIHTPGFNWMRLKQLSFAGSVGFHSAIYWAKNAVSGNKRAIAELEEMGLDAQDIISRNGQLTEAELQKGVYHFVNNRFFVNKTLDNSLYQNKNVIARSAYMYHSFVNSETAYIKRELLKMSKAGDYKGLAQFAGTLFILFPTFAPMLKSAEVLLRTGSPTRAGQGMQEDYKNLAFQNGPGEAAATYVEMLAHIGAAGAYYNYMNAIKGHRLANAALGPMIGMGLTDVEDIGNAGYDLAVKGDANINPLGRDATQMIPVAGKPLSHKLFPTRKEQSTSTSHRRGRRR